MSRSPLAPLLALGALLLAGRAPAQSVGAEVNRAIDRGVLKLLELQAPDGSFRHPSTAFRHGGYPMGTTALVAYTLRKSGLPRTDPALQAAVRHLRELPPRKTYSVATLILFLDALGEEGHTDWIQGLAAWLEEASEARTGLWAYPDGAAELSNTQFAVLGLWAASRHGYEVSSRSWVRLIETLSDLQNDDGGFGYRADYHPESSGGMTCAGITVLFLARQQLDERGASPSIVVADACLARAWEWLDRHVTATGNPAWSTGRIRDRGPDGVGSSMYHHYYLYGLERVAALCDRERIGGRDWYTEGALDLLTDERAEGGWGNYEDTCFSLLFLRRATFSGLHGKEYDLSRGYRPATWRMHPGEAPEGWRDPGFDDGAWAEGQGVFGEPEGGAFDQRVLCLRRPLEWQAPAEHLRLFARVDDTCEVWLNGVRAAGVESYTAGKYVELDLAPEARAALRPGLNHLAVRVVNTGGPGAFDLRLDPLGLDLRPDARLTERADRAQGRFWRLTPRADVPWMRRWSVLGAVPDEDRTGLNDAERLPDTQADPSAGRRRLGSTWREWLSPGGVVDLSALARRKGDALLWAQTYLHAEARTTAVLWLGTTCGVRVLLDGELLQVHNLPREDLGPRVVVPLELTPGAHSLVVKLAGPSQDARFAARLASPAGEPLPGVRFDLAADAADAGWCARTQPQLLSYAELWEALPTGRGALDFDREGDVLDLPVGPVARDLPRWYSGSRADYPTGGPADGAKGVLALAAPSPEVPARLVARLRVSSGRKRVRAALCPATTAGNRVRVRLGLSTGGAPTWVADRELVGGNPSTTEWVEVAGELVDAPDKELLVVLEVTTLGGDGVLYLDELELR